MNVIGKAMASTTKEETSITTMPMAVAAVLVKMESTIILIICTFSLSLDYFSILRPASNTRLHHEFPCPSLFYCVSHHMATFDINGIKKYLFMPFLAFVTMAMKNQLLRSYDNCRVT